ncbi:MAG: biotin--[acetyl-CoA-carboxylase] ligase [Candidatus Thioglobus sp.]|nr:MAG: biotin--[acetyl-CoA-carboxylase] ligase [Candidatus Thioglobus sp.]
MMSDRLKLIHALSLIRSHTVPELAVLAGLDDRTVLESLNALQADGIQIEKTDKDAFRLSRPIKPLNAEQLRALLKSKNYEFIEHLTVLDTVDSSSSWLGRKNDAGESIHGCACVTDFQSAGRGRRGRQWQGSPYAHIMFSLGWNLGAALSQIEGLSLSIGLTIASVIREFTKVEIGLKWPNDLWCANRKLGGILIETRPSQGQNSLVIIGVGLNIDEPRPDFLEVNQGITDLANQAKDISISREELAAALLSKIVQKLKAFPGQGFSADQSQFNALDIYFEKEIEAVSIREKIHGTSEGVDMKGRYQIRSLNGDLAVISAAELSLRAAGQQSKC